MSNHFSAAMLKFPGDGPCLDATDLYAFGSPQTGSPWAFVLLHGQASA
jgi:hypothetical protein